MKKSIATILTVLLVAVFLDFGLFQAKFDALKAKQDAMFNRVLNKTLTLPAMPSMPTLPTFPTI